MITVIGVRFKKAGKIYYFDPDNIDTEEAKFVIVETARGIEFGNLVINKRQITDDEIISPLKKVLRVATEDDILIHEENKTKKVDAFNICVEKIKLHDLEMKLVDVEYTFDNNKVIFYFTSDGRVDFRKLVKDLAAVFRTRIELRQIGVRDEAKMINGIGSCGCGLCCANWLGDFEPVSIKMAKDQNLSLNPSKISGVCGRLMCCLKFEHETYLDLKKDMPHDGETVMTPDGKALVLSTQTIRELIKVKLIIGEKNGVTQYDDDVLLFKKDEVKRINKGKKICPKHAEKKKNVLTNEKNSNERKNNKTRNFPKRPIKKKSIDSIKTEDNNSDDKQG